MTGIFFFLVSSKSLTSQQPIDHHVYVESYQTYFLVQYYGASGCAVCVLLAFLPSP